jgi:hypothetical protein
LDDVFRRSYSTHANDGGRWSDRGSDHLYCAKGKRADPISRQSPNFVRQDWNVPYVDYRRAKRVCHCDSISAGVDCRGCRAANLRDSGRQFDKYWNLHGLDHFMSNCCDQVHVLSNLNSVAGSMGAGHIQLKPIGDRPQDFRGSDEFLGIAAKDGHQQKLVIGNCDFL